MNNYNTFEGEKKKAFLAVMTSVLIMGIIYILVSVK